MKDCKSKQHVVVIEAYILEPPVCQSILYVKAEITEMAGEYSCLHKCVIYHNKM